MSEWRQYRRVGLSEMRPYVLGENLAGVSVQQDQVPVEGGLIARNPQDHSDQWYVTPDYVAINLELVDE